MVDPRHVRRIRFVGRTDLDMDHQWMVGGSKGQMLWPGVAHRLLVTYHLIHTKGQDFLSRSSPSETRSVCRDCCTYLPLVKLKVVPYFIFGDFFNGPVTFCRCRRVSPADVNVADIRIPFSFRMAGHCTVTRNGWMKKGLGGSAYWNGNLLTSSPTPKTNQGGKLYRKKGRSFLVRKINKTRSIWC